MYKNSREQREEENKILKEEKIKIYEYIKYLKRILIQNNICVKYNDYNNFNVQYCLIECDSIGCGGKEQIKKEYMELEKINKEIVGNQSYIDRDIFYN